METATISPGFEDSTPILSWLRPYVRQCGEAPRPQWSLKNRSLLDYLLVYIEKGRGIFRIGKKGWQAYPGDIFWIPPDTPHSMSGTSNIMICPFVHFDMIYRYPESHWEFSIPEDMTDLSDFGTLMHPPLPESPFSDMAGKYNLYNHKKIGGMLHELCLTAAGSHASYTIRMSGLLLEILSEILKGMSSVNGSRYAAAIESVADFIRKNLAEPLSVTDLAEICDLSEVYFRKIFKQHFGLSPKAFIRQTRIMHAKELMIYSEYTLGEIAEKCGFATVHSLSKAFSLVEGQSPSQYRRFGASLISTEGRIKAYPG